MGRGGREGRSQSGRATRERERAGGGPKLLCRFETKPNVNPFSRLFYLQSASTCDIIEKPLCENRRGVLGSCRRGTYSCRLLLNKTRLFFILRLSIRFLALGVNVYKKCTTYNHGLSSYRQKCYITRRPRIIFRVSRIARTKSTCFFVGLGGCSMDARWLMDGGCCEHLCISWLTSNSPLLSRG